MVIIEQKLRLILSFSLYSMRSFRRENAVEIIVLKRNTPHIYYTLLEYLNDSLEL